MGWALPTQVTAAKHTPVKCVLAHAAVCKFKLTKTVKYKIHFLRRSGHTSNRPWPPAANGYPNGQHRDRTFLLWQKILRISTELKHSCDSIKLTGSP